MFPLRYQTSNCHSSRVTVDKITPSSISKVDHLTTLIGTCTAQVLLATNFNDVPTDQTSWINLIGPARIAMRACARDKETGGVVVRNGRPDIVLIHNVRVTQILIVGNRGNLEVVLFNPNSVYGKVTILRHSKDPVARSIANQELLELLHLAPSIYDDPEEVQQLLNQSLGVDTAQPNATAMLDTA